MKALSRVIGFSALCAIGLSGCAEADSLAATEAKLPATFKTFSIDAKATKILEAPEGQIEVYDPLQDPLIRESFSKIYNDTATDAERADIEALFAFIHKIQMNDLLRAGCDKPLTQFCWATYETTIPADCEDREWGSAEMSRCEASHSKITPMDAIPAREGFCDASSSGEKVMYVPFQQIGLNKNYLPTEEDSFMNQFAAVCRVK